jgi:hypothetical protein
MGNANTVLSLHFWFYSTSSQPVVTGTLGMHFLQILACHESRESDIHIYRLIIAWGRSGILRGNLWCSGNRRQGTWSFLMFVEYSDHSVDIKYSVVPTLAVMRKLLSPNHIVSNSLTVLGFCGLLSKAFLSPS